MDMIDVVAGIVQHEGRILIARRKPGSHLAGFWEFPGGKIETNETPEQALVRELMEELAIRTETERFVAESVYDYGSKKIRLLGYLSRYIDGDFVLESHDSVQWVTITEIETYDLAPADIPILMELKRCAK